MKEDLHNLVLLKKLTMQLVSSQKKFIRLSDKRTSMTFIDNSPKQVDTAEANLNWHAMEHDKLKRDVHAVSVDCGLSLPHDQYDEIEYNPSAFHKYKHKPRVPLCRQPREI